MSRRPLRLRSLALAQPPPRGAVEELGVVVMRWLETPLRASSLSTSAKISSSKSRRRNRSPASQALRSTARCNVCNAAGSCRAKNHRRRRRQATEAGGAPTRRSPARCNVCNAAGSCRAKNHRRRRRQAAEAGGAPISKSGRCTSQRRRSRGERRWWAAEGCSELRGVIEWYSA